jgi:hypothetical protein
MLRLGWAAGVLLCAATAIGDDAPVIEHQSTPCSVPGKRIAVCASGRRLSKAFDEAGVSYVAAAAR